MIPDAMILVFWMLSFKPTFSLSSLTFIKRLFSSSSLSAVRVVSSAYLRLLIFLLSYHLQSRFITCSSVYGNSSSLSCYTDGTTSPAFPVLLTSSPFFFCNITEDVPTAPSANPPRLRLAPFWPQPCTRSLCELPELFPKPLLSVRCALHIYTRQTSLIINHHILGHFIRFHDNSHWAEG